MRNLLIVVLLCLLNATSNAQPLKVKKYPSLLWEITGKGMKKPSYLFGTMHVSNKMVFHLSDSFYIGIKNADVVALETNPATWQEDMSRYDMGENYSPYGNNRMQEDMVNDYLTINRLRFYPYEKLIEAGLHSNPAMINSFLYRSYEFESDFEEDTYLDLYIFQVGRKWGKKMAGVEDFDESMRLMKEAYADMAKEKNPRRGNNDYDENFSNAKLQEAYRTGNLDLLDTINQLNSFSAAFDEKFLYKRNELQANSIDSILKTKQSLFVGVGAAHLPGQRGVIEMLRKMGYKMRPIKMNERDSKHKDEIEQIRVPVQFSKQTAADGFYAVNLPGKLHSFMPSFGFMEQRQYADMANGSYYIVTRMQTNGAVWGHNETAVYKKVDSLLYENIPGKMLSKKEITNNGYKGFDITNRTRRGDLQRYNIFITPFEVIFFKMSGNGDYVKDGKESEQFFSSIELKTYTKEWKKYSPLAGGFEVEMPHQPVESKSVNWQYIGYDKETETLYEVLRSDVHNLDFVEEDSFDLNLMEESFATSDFIEKQLSRKHIIHKGYRALDAKYKHKDGSVSLTKFIIQGPRYYTLITSAKKENPSMSNFLNSFQFTSHQYGKTEKRTDTSFHFTVNSPVPLEKVTKLSMNPPSNYRYKTNGEDSLSEYYGESKYKVVESDSTGEKIFISFYKNPRYFFDKDTTAFGDTSHFKNWGKQGWVIKNHKLTELPNKMKVWEYETGSESSSRIIKAKSFYYNNVIYFLSYETDTLTSPSIFVSQFFQTFMPVDTVKGIDGRTKKSSVFFSDFFGKDTLLRKKAIYNISAVTMDSTDYPQLQKAIRSLSWKEKKYLDTKKGLIDQLSFIPTKAASDFLKEIYYAAGDTLEMQYRVLEVLLRQQTAYSFQVFKDIVLNEPPVLNIESGSSYNTVDRQPYRYNYDYDRTTVSTQYDNYESNNNYSNESFFDELNDSTKLTATIFKDLLPLINIEDYERPIMHLMAQLVDSNLISAKDYQIYMSKFLIEAKQAMKKQQISEKNKLIQKAQLGNEEVEENDYYSNKRDTDAGNDQLTFYSRLLLPFWDSTAQVPLLIENMLKSNDKRLKYNTAYLLLSHKKAVPDTLLKYFAANDEYRYELYRDLKHLKMESKFPSSFVNQKELAKSKLLYNFYYDQPDSIAYVDKLPLTHKGKTGFVYFFKYKQQKADNTWKIATIGLVPSDPKKIEFDFKEDDDTEDDYYFTDYSGEKLDNNEPVKPQLNKLLKKLVYKKRKSAARFYETDRHGDNIIDAMYRDR